MKKTPITTPVSETSKLTANQTKFCQLYVEQNCRLRCEAARGAGIARKASRQYATKTLKLPHVKAYIAELKAKKEKERKVDAIGEPSKIEDVTPEKVVLRMWDIFQGKGLSLLFPMSAQVTAGRALGHWLGLDDKQKDPFEGRTRQELEFFIANGYFPYVESLDRSEPRLN